DGKPELACQFPLAKAEGRSVLTIEGLAKGDRLHPLQQAFIDHGAMQCGYCTPGMILRAYALLLATPNPSEAAIADALEGNLCRCNNYTRIIAAVRAASQALKMKGVSREAR
ncbi:MAG TPA: 2Fe-2S iron-sulfur cluster-binding protein, partial [Acidobacteriota bacterium]|nr:2Fe-2S iron-sulfur cluster-binding protein [Acidobacteriota bacterium]